MRGSESGAGGGLYAAERGTMVDEQLARRGIRDIRVLDVMATVPRHTFVPAALRSSAYYDGPLPIGFGQTISQPFMVARATELASPRAHERALEIGAGCGYQTAVLAALCRDVFAIEIQPTLAHEARATLLRIGIQNAVIESFDGSGGWPAHAPYDVIVVSAAAPRAPVLLLDQLADGGRLVAPLGDKDEQILTVITRRGATYETAHATSCRYVPLLGRYGVGAETIRS